MNVDAYSNHCMGPRGAHREQGEEGEVVEAEEYDQETVHPRYMQHQNGRRADDYKIHAWTVIRPSLSQSNTNDSCSPACKNKEWYAL